MNSKNIGNFNLLFWICLKVDQFLNRLFKVKALTSLFQTIIPILANWSNKKLISYKYLCKLFLFDKQIAYNFSFKLSSLFEFCILYNVYNCFQIDWDSRILIIWGIIDSCIVEVMICQILM